MWLTPRRNLSLKDSDFFLFNFFRCFFSIMMAAASAEWPQLFRNLIVWSIHWRSQVILSSCFGGEQLICFNTRLHPTPASAPPARAPPARAPTARATPAKAPPARTPPARAPPARATAAVPSTPGRTPDWLLIWLGLTPHSLSIYFKNSALVQKLLTSHLEWNLVD